MLKKMNILRVIYSLRSPGIHGISGKLSITRQVAEQRMQCKQLIAQSTCLLHSQSWQCTPNLTRVFCKVWTPLKVQVQLLKKDALCLKSELRFLSFSVAPCIRQSSSNPSITGKDFEVIDKDSVSEEGDWSHPASRTEDVLFEDTELRSILCEIASDFGKSQSIPSDSETTETHEHNASIVESNSVPPRDLNLKEDVVAMTMKYEDVGESIDVVEVSHVKASRKNDKTSFVFSIDDIVEILREENAQNVCVIAVPPEKNYVDYFIVVTGRSTRHLSAMTQFINKLYKQRKGKGDPFLIVEGKFAEDWMCLDFGNIVIHFMLEETRALYNLEELWTIGKEFDSHIQQWDQHEVLLFNPETDLQTTPSEEQEDTQEKQEPEM